MGIAEWGLVVMLATLVATLVAIGYARRAAKAAEKGNELALQQLEQAKPGIRIEFGPMASGRTSTELRVFALGPHSVIITRLQVTFKDGNTIDRSLYLVADSSKSPFSIDKVFSRHNVASWEAWDDNEEPVKVAW